MAKNKSAGLTTSQLFELREVTRPLKMWLADNAHPHATAIITQSTVEILEGIAVFSTGPRLEAKDLTMS